MGVRTGNPTWKDHPDTTTPLTAAALNAIEAALDASPINARTGTSYALVASDVGKYVTLNNAAAISLTVPANVFTAGQEITCIVLGAGMVTISPGTGAPAVNGTPSLVSRAQYSAFTIVCLSPTSFVVVGDLA